MVKRRLPEEPTINDIYRGVSLERTNETGSGPWWGNLPERQRRINKKGLEETREALGLPNKESMK